MKGFSPSDKDPVFIASSANGERLSRGTMCYPTYIKIGPGPEGGSSIRIVLGPDLLAEQAKKR